MEKRKREEEESVWILLQMEGKDGSNVFQTYKRINVERTILGFQGVQILTLLRNMRHYIFQNGQTLKTKFLGFNEFFS